MKRFLLSSLIFAALGSLAANADVSAEKIILEPHEGGPKVRVVLRETDHSSKEYAGPMENNIYVTLYARKAGDSDWQRVVNWKLQSHSAGEAFYQDILTRDSGILKDLDGKPWEGKVVVENPGIPARQKFLTPTFDTAVR